jgi:hypothetical protein
VKKQGAKKMSSKPLALQLHDHLRAHKGCSKETCATNRDLRNQYEAQAQRGR